MWARIGSLFKYSSKCKPGVSSGEAGVEWGVGGVGVVRWVVARPGWGGGGEGAGGCGHGVGSGEAGVGWGVGGGGGEGAGGVGTHWQPLNTLKTPRKCKPGVGSGEAGVGCGRWGW